MCMFHFLMLILMLCIMQALQKHGVYEANRTALTSLAQLIYETLVRPLHVHVCVCEFQHFIEISTVVFSYFTADFGVAFFLEDCL